MSWDNPCFETTSSPWVTHIFLAKLAHSWQLLIALEA